MRHFKVLGRRRRHDSDMLVRNNRDTFIRNDRSEPLHYIARRSGDRGPSTPRNVREEGQANQARHDKRGGGVRFGMRVGFGWPAGNHRLRAKTAGSDESKPAALNTVVRNYLAYAIR